MLSDTERREIAIQLRDRYAVPKGFQKFIHQGRSMSPILREGNQILVKTTLPQDLHFGDIIVYKSKDLLIAHRFLYRKFRRNNIMEIVAKADNSSERDSPFSSDCLLGKVVEIIKKGKTLNLEGDHWRIISFLIGTVSLLEAIIFETICTLRMRCFKRLKVKNTVRKNVARLIRIPKFLLSKTLISSYAKVKNQKSKRYNIDRELL